MLLCCVHCSLFNLLVSVPNWRPSSDSAAAFIVDPSPSGFVPGDGEDGRGVERIVFFSGEGPDRFLQSFVEVLFVKVKGLIVFSFSFKAPFVICNPTE
jgi:hypothetical protein